MTKIKIVPYHSNDAASVADMWNRSSEEWGGGTSVRSAEQVRHNEENSDALAVLLAVSEEEVVGYCSIGEYRDDVGALYIQLLNVRPDFHGHKIGKRLVLRAIEEAMNLGWPRIDLYTWEANMKAVPLYKRCGFFWEDREDSVHFMNFIPQIAASEAIQPYFNRFDWYGDLVRTIEMKPDGEKKAGFETYSYVWNKEQETTLRVDIERRGRGICYIETDDYIISACAEQAEPVCGFRYQIKYQISNKTDQPLQLLLQGESNEHIAFEWQSEMTITGEQEICTDFFVKEMTEECNEGRTCPAIQTNVMINGLAVKLKIGVIPKFPAKLKLHVPMKKHRLAGEYTLYLDIQNQLTEAAEFSFELPNTNWLTLEQSHLRLRLQAKEKASIAIPYRLLNYGFYREEATITATAEDGKEVVFTYIIASLFVGPGAMVAGETNSDWIIWNGKYSTYYNKERNDMTFQVANREQAIISLLPPLLGKPYSNEFARKKPSQVQLVEHRGEIGYRQTYQSDSFPQLILHMCTILYADGTMRVWHEVENHSSQGVTQPISVAQRIYTNLYRLVLPYDGQIVELTNSQGNDYEFWDDSKVDEPWLFVHGDETPCSIAWSSNQRMRFGDWFLEIESTVPTIPAGETKQLDEIFLSIGSFEHWQEFRAYVLQLTEVEHKLLPIHHMDVVVADGNPFLQANESEVLVTLRDFKQNVWNGEVTITYAHLVDAPVEHLSFEDALAEKISCSLPNIPADYKLVEVTSTIGSQLETFYSALFMMSSTPIRYTTSTAGIYSVDEVDNGIIRISAAANYYPTLHSLTINGQEWLASGFPAYGAKSWWNPWIGGIHYSIGNMNAASVRQEKHESSLVELQDSQGNVWSGIRIRQSIEHHEVYKGMTIDSYYMLLPGVPIVALLLDIRQNSGAYIETELNNELFPDMEELRKGWLRTFTNDGETLHYVIGDDELSVRESKAYGFGRKEYKGVMQVVTNESVNRPVIYANKEVCCLTYTSKLRLPEGILLRTKPIYLVFTDELLPISSLAALRHLGFPIVEEEK